MKGQKTYTFENVDFGKPPRAFIVATLDGVNLISLTIDGVSVDPYSWKQIMEMKDQTVLEHNASVDEGEGR